MNAVAHIAFKFRKERIEYLKLITSEFNKYPFNVDVFIHSDKKFDIDYLNEEYNNGTIVLKKHNLRKYFLYKGWKYRLTFTARKLIAKQKENYDIFIYLEDDILIPLNAIKYWLSNKDLCIENNLNLGFLRIEVKNKVEYLSDITQKINKTIDLDDKKFVINNRTPYTAFWIYDKSEFNKWVKSDFYDLKIIHGYKRKNSRLLKFLKLSWSKNLQYLIYDWQHKRIDSVMEANAYGLAHPDLNWYENTIIKLENNKIDKNCRVYHLANTYVNENETDLGTLKIEDLLDIE